MLGHEKRQRRDDGVMPYGLTPGQTFDVVDTGVDISRGFQGSGGPVSWPVAAFAGLDIAISAGTAPPGKMPGRVAGAVAAQTTGLLSWYVGGPVAATASGALGGIVGGVFGGPLGADLGATVGAFVGRWGARIVGPIVLDPMVRKISRPVDRIAGALLPRVNFGGFQDFAPAYTMRQRALREMQGSLLNAYQYLGREAQLMHQ